jgi:AcrR family transcriptional regulator
MKLALSTSEKAPYHHGDLRRSLLDAALGILHQDGIGAVSLREVARAAGVSHNAPYRHFPSRDALLAGVAAEGFGRLRARLEAAGDDLAALRALDRVASGRAVSGGDACEIRTIGPATLRAWAIVHGFAHLVADGQLSLEAASRALAADGTAP